MDQTMRALVFKRRHASRRQSNGIRPRLSPRNGAGFYSPDLAPICVAGSLRSWDQSRAQDRERAAALAAERAKRAEAERKAVAEAQKIVAIWNARAGWWA
jgi:hypothetical protein